MDDWQVLVQPYIKSCTDVRHYEATQFVWISTTETLLNKHFNARAYHMTTFEASNRVLPIGFPPHIHIGPCHTEVRSKHIL